MIGVNDKKLFIHSLGYYTTRDTIIDYFSQYGEVIDCELPSDVGAPHHRGYGFVHFKYPRTAAIVIQNGPHVIDNCKIGMRAADNKAPPLIPRPPPPQSIETTSHFTDQNDISIVGKRIFVGGIRQQHTRDKLFHFFSSYGQVDTVEILVNRETKVCRGFAFISFVNEEPVNELVKKRFVCLEGQRLELKPAFFSPKNPREEMRERISSAATSGGKRFSTRSSGPYKQPPSLMKFRHNLSDQFQSVNSSGRMSHRSLNHPPQTPPVSYFPTSSTYSITNVPPPPMTTNHPPPGFLSQMSNPAVSRLIDQNQPVLPPRLTTYAVQPKAPPKPTEWDHVIYQEFNPDAVYEPYYAS